MFNLEQLSLRDLQKESARALMVLGASNGNISRFNSNAHHDSQNWYKAVIQWYVDEFGGLPSQVGPAVSVKLFSD